MSYSELIVEFQEPLAVITLNRPEKVNALSRRMIRELIQAFGELASRRDVRAVVLGASGKHFCAGHLLDEMVGRPTVEYQRIFEDCTRMMLTIQHLPQPVIAAVQGVATAAGCQLVAACDLVVAERTARFCTPGVKIGLFCSTPAVALVRAVGRKRALEMLLTGRWVHAPEAAEWGLVNRVVEPGKAREAAIELAREIAQASGLTLELGKRTFYEQVNQPDPQAYALATRVMALNLAMNDAQEGIRAFLEKRSPSWSDS